MGKLSADDWLYMHSESDEAYLAAVAAASAPKAPVIAPPPPSPAARRAIKSARRVVEMHAVYRMYADDGELLYVGMTSNPGQRFGDHASRRWFPLVASITLEWHPNSRAARTSERQAIKTEGPRFNVREKP
jgi:predicted GIY-YIG superfamily endonuclease